MKRLISPFSLRWISALAILILVLSACAPTAPVLPSTPATTAPEVPSATPAPSNTPAATLAPTTAATEAIAVTGTTAASLPASMTPTGPVTVNVASDATLGKFLVDEKGMTLYIFSDDTPGLSTCSGDCLKAWPPLLTNGAPIAGTGVDASKLAKITLANGTSMVTYDKQPLYYYFKDTGPGNTTGNGVDGSWYIIAP